MNLRDAIRLFLVPWLALLTLHAIADEQAKVTGKKINDRVYVVLGGNGQGAHAGVIFGNDGIVLVDSMMEESGQKLLKAIREISDKPIKYVINTHDHFDHSGGNFFFSSRGATIVSHEAAQYDQPLDLFSYANRFTLSGTVEKIEAFHVSSHSASDAIIYLRDSNVIFLGDIFTNEWYPALFHGGIKGQNKALDLALSIMDQDTVVVPGHGFITNKAGVLAYRENSDAWVKRIVTLHNKGFSLEKIIEDSKLKKLQKTFNSTNKNPDNFNKWFKELVKNTIEIEVALRESP
jgi:glyoxylase-like metal-dependent hydrolase (beta-lactamase superfamily II)